MKSLSLFFQKRFSLITLVVLITILGVVGWWQSSRSTKQISLNQLQNHQIVPVILGEQKLMVEIVKTPQSISQGLSGRTTLGSDGMLFFLPETQVAHFWMKEMQFGLDFIWLKDQQVVDLTLNVPPPDPVTPLSQLPVYSPNTPVDMVLEVEAGRVNQWQIERGDLLHFLLK